MNFLNKYKNSLLRKVALFLAFTIFFQTVYPPYANALTGGPSQPEMAGFQPIGTSNMVDLFTGDFNYSIPLMDVDGYPINISYSAGSMMDQEASWVGLGWSLNPGVITRNLRGIPDDFKGDKIKKEMNIRDDVTVGLNLETSFELLGLDLKKVPGIDTLSLSAGIFYNNRRKFGVELSSSPGFSISKSLQKNSVNTETGASKNKDSNSSGTSLVGNVNLNLSFNSQSGFGVPGVAASLGLIQTTDRKQGSKKNHDPSDVTKGARVLNDKNRMFGGGMRSGIKPTARVSLADFNDFTSFPKSPMPMRNIAFAFDGKLSGEIFGLAPGTKIGGYVNQQKLDKKQVERASYGYLNLENSNNDINAIQDYNKEKSLPFHKDKPILPISFGTYDLFSVTGHGVTGQFRAMRNDVGIFRDPGLINRSINASGGIEPGAGAFFKLGANLSAGGGSTKVKKWSDNNELEGLSDFTKADGVYENVFFKGTGQKIITNKSHFDLLKGEFPMEAEIANGTLSSKVKPNYLFEDDDKRSGSFTPTSTIKRGENSREKRNQLFSFITHDEKKLGYGLAPLQDDGSVRKGHHMSEVYITQEDGSRYVYGIPAYNRIKKEVTFNREKVTTNGSGKGAVSNSSEYIEYEPGVDNSINNNQGEDYYYDSEEYPGYAHSFLLTHVLSHDYVDLTGNGISDDDLGNVIELKYNQTHGVGGENYYKWRIPYEKNIAQFSDGHKSKTDDDKASYVYGEKELFYLQTIESRTMVAKFHTSSRLDALGVAGENGGDTDESNSDLVPATMEKLDKIELFSKAEYYTSDTPTPIKTVHFTYEGNSEKRLCNGVPNSKYNGAGKLTLKSIHFTYENSNRGKLNAYKFGYSQTNPLYELQATDRWGCYRQSTGLGNLSNNPNYPKNLPNASDFPYVLQQHSQPGENEEEIVTKADEFANAWNLNSIELPSGSTISLKYEADDYAYVQDHRAGQMMFIEGFSSVKPDGTNQDWDENLYENKDDDKDRSPKDFLILSLPQKIASNLSEGEAYKILNKKYFEDVGEQIYFQSAVNLTGEQDDIGKYEFIKGYMDFDEFGFVPNSDYSRIFIKLNTVKVRTQDYHPITMATLQSIRLNFPEILHPSSPSENIEGSALIKALLGYAGQIGSVINGFNKSSIRKGWGQKIDLNKSWIRLANPDFKKQGGGCRVSEISILDGWSQLNDSESVYGQKYTYTTNLVMPNGESAIISSGVASYEPLIGNDENLMRKPLRYEELKFLGTDNSYYIETPIGESLYPMASVGYSEVKVESFGTYKGVTKHGVGYSLNKFHTAKDFPVKVKYSELSKKRIPNIGKFLSSPIQKDKLAVSQGFSVEINDMHGKPFFEAVYDNGDNKISSTTYEYLREKDTRNTPLNELSNLVKVITPSGYLSEEYLGVEMDVWQEMQQDQVKVKDIGISPNTDGFLGGFIPLVIPVILPDYQDYENEFSSATTTKLIKRFGLVDKVTVEENGSSIQTINKLYDSETGEVLLTETQNEFDDPVYNLKYPAHWVYDGMGLAYQNSGATFEINIEDGEVVQDITTSALIAGDELLVIRKGETENDDIHLSKQIVVNPSSDPDKIKINNANGVGLDDGEYIVKVLRSGHRNQAGSAIASITTLVDPSPSENEKLIVSQSDEVVQATAVEFDDFWQMRCERVDTSEGENALIPFENYNPYSTGVKGNWRPKRSYVYHADRTGASLPEKNVNIRKQGFFENFTPFWEVDNTNNWQANLDDNRWVKANTVEMYDVRGNELENQDAIGNYSAAQFGYDDTRATAIASNAQKCEINYDGFEDYFFENNPLNILFSLQNRFTFVDDPSLSILSNEAAHTGRYSLKIPPQGFVEESSKLKPYTNICGVEDCSNDLTPPSLMNIPVDLSFECGSVPDLSVPDSISASDNCDSNVSISLAEITQPGNCSNAYQIVRTWTATDASGNSSSSTQVIMFEDNTTPSILRVPSNITLNCGDDLPIADIAAVDGCDGSINLIENVEASNNCVCPDSIIRSWIATDNCGNSISAEQVITILNPDEISCDDCQMDMIPPIISGVPNDTLLSCSSIPEMPINVFATDDCDNNVNSNLFFNETILEGACDHTYDIARTWSVSDESGNSTVETQTIQVIDTTPPILINVPEDLTLACGFEIPDASIFVLDNCDNSVVFSLSEVFNPSPDDCNINYDITRTWLAVDDCGNSVVEEQVVTVIGNFSNLSSNNDEMKSFPLPNNNRNNKIASTNKVLDNFQASNQFNSISDCQQCLPTLHLMPEKEYFITVWVATDSTIKYGGSPNIGTLNISYLSNALELTSEIVSFTPKGPIVEGWQRISGAFVVPANATDFNIRIANGSVVENLFVDDFRIHPMNSNMVSYVYDPFSLRLWATLDDNNYASFYEYDDEGILVRSKRETESGIVTVQESRTVLSPNNDSE